MKINKSGERKGTKSAPKKTANKPAVKRSTRPPNPPGGRKEQPAKLPAQKKSKTRHKAESRTIYVRPGDVEKVQLFDTARFTYFDTRFYRLTVPINIHKSFLVNIPVKYINELPKDKEMDIYLPSSTTIIGFTEPKGYLLPWYGRVGYREALRTKNDALIRGSIVHDAIDKYTQGGYAIIYQNLKINNVTNEEIEAFKKKNRCQVVVLHEQDEIIMLNRFERLLQLVKPRVEETEFALYNIMECYGGTIDQRWIIDKTRRLRISTKQEMDVPKGHYILDFKTGDSFNEVEYWTQAASYIYGHPLTNDLDYVMLAHLNSDNKGGIEGVKIYIKSKGELLKYYNRFLWQRDLFIFGDDGPDISPKVYEYSEILYNPIKLAI